MEVFLFIAIALAVIASVLYGHVVAQQRQNALAAVAARLGLAFHEEKDRDLPARLEFLHQIDQGSNRYAYNRLSGSHRGEAVMVFDFHYQTGGGKNTQHHHLTVLTLQLPRSFPELIITPEGIFSKVAQSLGYDDIDFESAEFSNAFCVRSRDRKFAYDVCHPLTMEYLLGHPELAIEIEGNLLAVAFDTQLEPDEVEHRLDQLLEIRQLMPGYLFSQA